MLPRAEHMHARRDHLVTRLESARYRNGIRADAADGHGLQAHGHGAAVEHPHRRLARFFKQCRQRDTNGARQALGLDLHRYRLAQRQIGLAHVCLDGEGSRNRIHRSRHLSNGSAQRLRMPPGLDQQRTRLANQRAYPGGTVFRHREDHITRAIVCETHHGRPRPNHLPHLGIDLGDDAGSAGLEIGVGRLVALHRRLRPRLHQGGLGGLQTRFASFQLGCADETLAAQLTKALDIGDRLIVVGLRRDQARTSRVLPQAQVLGIKLSQDLAGPHGLTQFDQPAHDLATHAKAESRLHPRTHLARKFIEPDRHARAHHHGSHRAHRLCGRLGARTGGQQGSNHHHSERVSRQVRFLLHGGNSALVNESGSQQATAGQQWKSCAILVRGVSVELFFWYEHGLAAHN